MTRTFADIERSHERARERKRDAQDRKDDQDQIKKDTLVSSYYRDSGYVEDVISENADLVEKMVRDCESGAFGDAELGERLLSMVNYHLELKADKEL